jgi:hypothetical protein
MKENRSLALSLEIRKQMQKDTLGVFTNYFPFQRLSELTKDGRRDRVYNTENTILTMITSMVQQDKSLQNSVNLFCRIHDNNKDRINKLEQELQELENNIEQKKVGRPKKKLIKIQKSKLQSISVNTSAYAQARQRLNIENMFMIFNDSKVGFKTDNKLGHFHGRKVYLGDGTYVQLQDTESIRTKYFANGNEYPRGLLEVLIEQGTGIVHDFVIEDNKKSELEILANMIQNIPANSLLVADDLYNCFAIFSMLKSQSVDILVPVKRKRNYELLEVIGQGDEIVRIKATSDKSKIYRKFNIQEQTLVMRKIEVVNPYLPDKKITLLTSILDKKISKEEILLQYINRWDIEINIREIKAIMGMNVIRGKSLDMVIKELISGFIAYNYVRRLIIESTIESDFSPERDIIQEYYEIDNPLLIDSKGRVYSKWSPGRYGANKVRSAIV